MIVMGLDPGATGGLAVVGPHGLVVRPWPASELDLWRMIARPVDYWNSVDGGVVAVVEKVGGFVKGNPTPGSSMFNFGVSYGQLRMALVAADIPFAAVTPQKWQAEFGLVRAKDEKKYAFKSRLAAKAREIYPDVKFARDVADAVLICEYCRRHHRHLFPTKS